MGVNIMNNLITVFAVVFMYSLVAFLLIITSAILAKIFWPIYDKKISRNTYKIPYIPIHTRKKNT